jgi:hypothetical protein
LIQSIVGLAVDSGMGKSVIILQVERKEFYLLELQNATVDVGQPPSLQRRRLVS